MFNTSQNPVVWINQYGHISETTEAATNNVIELNSQKDAVTGCQEKCDILSFLYPQHLDYCKDELCEDFTTKDKCNSECVKHFEDMSEENDASQACSIACDIADAFFKGDEGATDADDVELAFDFLNNFDIFA